MGRKRAQDKVLERIIMKLIEEKERFKKERDEARLEALRLLDLYLKEKKEKEKLLNENVKLRML